MPQMQRNSGINHQPEDKTMTKQAAEFGLKMAVLDAIEKGHTDKEEMIAYMASETCKKAAAEYAKLFDQEFN